MKILFEYGVKIPVKNYGGMERVLYWLMKELVKLGHSVYLIGNPQSQVKQIGVELIPKDESLGDNWQSLIPPGIDVIHLFNTPAFDYHNLPVMVTIHGNGKIGEQFINNTVFLSKKHAQNHGSDQFVYNGIDFDESPFKGRKKSDSWNKFMFLAKASWKVKNLNDCVKACKGAQKQLHVAGGRAYSFSKYINSHGMVDSQKKLELFNSVDGLLFPVRWHEPFGLAIIEAMGQGLPVVGSSFGSLPELITPEVGAICNSYQEFFDIISADTNRFDPECIREYAVKNFSSRCMALSYVEYYKKIQAGQQLNDKKPMWKVKVDAQALLAF